MTTNLLPAFSTDLDLEDRCAIYLRISLDKDGDETAVERQRKDAHAIARLRGWDVVQEYVDNSISASRADIERPAYEQMRRDYRSGKFGAIITYDLDRLTRQPRQLEDWIDEAERNGLVIVTTNGEADLSTDGGRMFARIKAAVARSEVERKGARQKSANKQRADKGHWQFSRRPYGYKRVNGEITIVESEAEIVREGYRRYIAGETYYAISNDWNERGVQTFSGPWSMARVRNLLRNEHYAGIVIYNGERIDAEPQWEPLIDERTWSDYVEQRDGRKRKGTWSNATKYLMSGLLVCGVCGSKLFSRPEYTILKDGTRTKVQGYQCTTNWCVSINGEGVDEFVEALVLARLADKRITRALRKTPDTGPLQQELDKLRRDHERLTDLLIEGVLDKRSARRRGVELKAKIEDRQQRLAALRRESPLTDLALARSVPSRWKKLSMLERRRVIEDLGLKVSILRTAKGRRARDERGRLPLDAERVIVEWITGD